MTLTLDAPTVDGGTLTIEGFLFMLEQEPPCESNHKQDDNRVCSHRVVARKMYSCCGASQLICENSYKANLKWFEAGNQCGLCDRLVRECSRVFLI